jgi:tetratricopeptide (TPR) repeat protein
MFMQRLALTLALISALQATAIFVAAPNAPTQQSPADRFTTVANKLVEAINRGDYEAITREFGPQMLAGLPLEKAQVFFQGLKARMGKIEKIDAPRLTPPDEAWFLTHFERGVLEMKIILDGQNRVSGLGFLPVEPKPAARDEKDEVEQGPAEKLFRAGKFSEAERAYARLREADPKNYQATFRLGHLALLENRFKDAEKWLLKAVGLQPDARQAKSLLAEAYYRQDQFARAAPLFRAAGQEVIAKKLESFGKRVPYQLPKKDFEVHVKFLQTDPLPLISARVNGSEPANFLIDTGGAEVILGAEFAKQVGAVEVGQTSGLLAAGPASFGNGRIDSFVLGDFEVRHLPIKILDAGYFAGGAPGKKVDGIVGTVFLYHFLSTLDYVNGELILRPRSRQSLTRWEELAKKAPMITVPFWMASDHFILAWGRINDSQPLLWFVDTGLAGRGFIGTDATLKEAGIETGAPPGEGATPSGAVVARTAPFVVEKLALGDAVEHKISGLRGNFSGLGSIQIAGIISHQFFKPYALTLDFTGMRLFLKRKA